MSHIKSKAELRKELRKQRQQLSNSFIEASARKIAHTLLKLNVYLNATTFAYYLPNEGEVDPKFIVQHAEQNRKKCFLPTLSTNSDKQLEFFLYRSGDLLTNNRYGIPEPQRNPQDNIDISKLDLILIPLVAFDKTANRLGRGAGYYDRTLAFIHQGHLAKRPSLIGLAYEFQQVPNIPTDRWDVKLDMVITEDAIYG